MKRFLLIFLGFVSLGFGTLGIVLPVLPTVPFYLATAFCFAKSSRRLHSWFVGTKLYQNHLESFVKKEGMTPKTKWSIIVTVTLTMGISAFLMMRKGVWIPCLLMGLVWIAHVIYLGFRVKTIVATPSAG